MYRFSKNVQKKNRVYLFCILYVLHKIFINIMFNIYCSIFDIEWKEVCYSNSIETELLYVNKFRLNACVFSELKVTFKMENTSVVFETIYMKVFVRCRGTDS